MFELNVREIREDGDLSYLHASTFVEYLFSRALATTSFYIHGIRVNMIRNLKFLNLLSNLNIKVQGKLGSYNAKIVEISW